MLIERCRENYNTVRPHSGLGLWASAPETIGSAPLRAAAPGVARAHGLRISCKGMRRKGRALQSRPNGHILYTRISRAFSSVYQDGDQC